MLLKQIITTFCLIVGSTVLLNGVHAKDLFALQVPAVGVQHTDDQNAKIVGDLHPHLDKQVGKVMQDTPQLDGRSFRLRDYKRIQLSALRNWLEAWRNNLATFLS